MDNGGYIVRAPVQEEPGWLQSIGLQSHTCLSACTHTHTHTHTRAGSERHDDFKVTASEELSRAWRLVLKTALSFAQARVFWGLQVRRVQMQWDK